VFGYAHVPGFKAHQKRIAEAALPGGPERQAQADAIAGALEAAGYVAIGLDHYARPGDALAVAQREGRLHRNFQGYTTDAAEVLLGFGASAIGRLPQGYVQNAVVMGAYAQAVAQTGLATAKGYALTAEDRLRAEVIERLMCDFAVDLEAVAGRHGVAVGALLAHAAGLPALMADGLVTFQGGVLAMAPAARPLVRVLAAQFDSFRAKSSRTHARAV
jgi:oxygen-independent coproporphyrinogen-3 oxidase